MKKIIDCTKFGIEWASKHINKPIKGTEHNHKISMVQITQIISDLCRRGKNRAEIRATLKAFIK